jgi:probable HAF family extracellular repeat protein
MVDLGTLGDGNGTPRAVHNGMVTGLSTSTNGNEHAFAWTASMGMVDLGALASWSEGNAVHNGAVTGYGDDASGLFIRAFHWTQNTGMQDLGTLGGAEETIGQDIHGGTVVGGGFVGDGSYHAFRWTQNTGIQDLGTLGGSYGFAHSVNNGTIIGESYLTGDTNKRGFVWRQDIGMVDLGTLGGQSSSASRLNSSGHIVGAADDGNGGMRAVLWKPSTISYSFGGFSQPVDDPPALNSLKAGSGVPVKFGLGGNYGLNILKAGSPNSQAVACSLWITTDAVEETTSAGSSTLSYDAATNQYTYVWKTEKGWANTCRQLTLSFNDGTVKTAYFKFTK